MTHTSSTIPTKFSNIYYKCENFQKTGSFKFRGATSAVTYYNSLPKDHKFYGQNCFVTQSSGNHGQALAKACQIFNKECHIVMPTSSPECKVAAVKSYNSDVIFCYPSDQAREDACVKCSQDFNGKIIDPSQDPLVIAGQGTIGIELEEQLDLENLDAILIAVGGGGLISGIATYIKAINPKIKIIGLEPEIADDCKQSKAAGKIVPNAVYPNTIADGVRVTIGPNSWPIIRDKVDLVYTFSEAEIIEGFRLGMERLKVVLEPTAGLCVVAVTSEAFYEAVNQEWPDHKIQNISVILCGGNVDLNKMSEILKNA